MSKRGSCVIGRRLKFERVCLKDAVLGSHCTSVGVSTAIKIAASWVVTGVNMLHSSSFFHFSYILSIARQQTLGFH